jgi:hypothetical protein
MATTEKKTTARRMERRLQRMLQHHMSVSRVETFAEAGILTRDHGLQVHLYDGPAFQITIIRDRVHGD